MRLRALNPGPMFLLGFGAVALQRFAVHFGSGQAQLSLLVTVVIGAMLLIRGNLWISLGRSLFFSVFVSFGAIVLLVRMGGDSSRVSVASLLLLVAIYWLACTRLVQTDPLKFWSGVLYAAVLGSVGAWIQSMSQAVFGVFIDPIQALPKSLIASGFSVTYEVTYGQALLKSNGIIYPEPSFLSIFCAVGILLIVTETVQVKGRGWYWGLIVLLGSAMVLSVSASGFLVLPFVALALIVRRRLRSAALLLAVGTYVVSATPLGRALFDKAGEGVATNTSTALRLVLPYEAILPEMWQYPLVGFGAGSAYPLIDRTFPGVQAPTMVKLLIEYGIVGSALLLIVIAWHVASAFRARSILCAAVLVAWAVPTDGLLNPALAVMVVVGLSGFTSEPEIASVNLDGKEGGKFALSQRSRVLTTR